MKKQLALYCALTLLSACAGALKKDFTKTPFNIERDDMNKTTAIYSNWIESYGNREFGSFKPYFIGSEKLTYFRAKVVVASGGQPIYYRKLSLRCGDQEPIHVTQKPFENWSKRFENMFTGQYILTSEHADIQIPKQQIDYILTCESSLKVRLSGDSQYAEIEYTKSTNPEYFRGLADLKKFIEEMIAANQNKSKKTGL